MKSSEKKVSNFIDLLNERCNSMRMSLTIDSLKSGGVNFSIYEETQRVYQGSISNKRILGDNHIAIINEITAAIDNAFSDLASSGKLKPVFSLDELFESSDQGFFNVAPTVKTYTHIPDLSDEKILLIKSKCVKALESNNISYTDENINKLVETIHNGHLSYRATDYSKPPDVSAQVSIQEIIRLYKSMFG